ncbi:MAG: hypothetical protein E6053_07570 [Finegoldia magna]|jgi:hypothetical protein|uniref:hypothetical protein n=1 Tax=Finegoldia magna TaxID=1260 RepID=UPI00290E6D5E|nr:hypothetical protein [Finegoldia magna]MDU5527310.1 hypothetical protein [Finegoldia magna]
MKNVKKTILDILKKSVDEDITVSYADTNNTNFPRISYYLVYHGKLALSNKKHKDTFLYQIDYFSLVPLDIETDKNLNAIYSGLDKIFCISEWNENVEVDVDEDSSIYHYYMEARI